MIKFEDLAAVQEFTSKDKNKILRYIGMVYDKKSEFNVIENLDERKAKAMEICKLDDESIPLMKNESVNELICVYLGVFQNSNKYHNWQANQHLFWNLQRSLMEPLTIDANEDEEKNLKRLQLKLAISKGSDELLSRIQLQEAEIFGGDKEQEAAGNLIRKELSIKTPEQRLKKVV